MTELQNTLAAFIKDVESLDKEIARFLAIREEKIAAIDHLNKSGIQLPEEAKPEVAVSPLSDTAPAPVAVEAPEPAKKARS